jgi:hypothetical protein
MCVVGSLFPTGRLAGTNPRHVTVRTQGKPSASTVANETYLAWSITWFFLMVDKERTYGASM